MTPQEIEHQNIKAKLRKEAIDKEVHRLKDLNRKQSQKISKLRKTLFFLILFFITLTLVLVTKGLINLSGSQAEKELESVELKYNQLKGENISLNDSLKQYKKQLNAVLDKNISERNEKGLKFRVQIGAFKEINLKDFTSNLVAINQESYDSINQYTVGIFTDYSKAKVFLADIKRMGFNDSFIISTKNGRRIPIEKLSEKDLYPNGKK
jgi:biopolymer transport protein ExbD